MKEVIEGLTTRFKYVHWTEAPDSIPGQGQENATNLNNLSEVSWRVVSQDDRSWWLQTVDDQPTLAWHQHGLKRWFTAWDRLQPGSISLAGHLDRHGRKGAWWIRLPELGLITIDWIDGRPNEARLVACQSTDLGHVLSQHQRIMIEQAVASVEQIIRSTETQFAQQADQTAPAFSNDNLEDLPERKSSSKGSSKSPPVEHYCRSRFRLMNPYPTGFVSK